MTQQAACPDPAQLEKLLQGTLPAGAQTQVTSHLETCVDCQQTLEHMAADGQGWSGAAKHLREGQPAPEAALQQAIEMLKVEASEAPTLVPEEGAQENELSFLGPPEKAGQLGKLDTYEVLEVIGRGGMGMVLKAFDPSLHRIVAVKVLARHLAASPTNRKRFIREARATAAVRHENVIVIYAVNEQAPLPYLVMEYVEGMSLQERLDRASPMELEEIVHIGAQAAHGLAAAHANGLIHRDIKPANLLLQIANCKLQIANSGTQPASCNLQTAIVKIADFGLARAVDDVGLTQSGAIAGTPQYMAPEQAAGKTLDHRADLFSMGSVLYAMCTGRPPFAGDDTVSILYNVSKEQPRAIREQNPGIPEWLIQLIDNLHAKDPAQRCQSARELAELLAQYQAHVQEPGRTPPPGLAPRALQHGPWRKVRAWLAAAAGLLLVAVATVIYVRTRDGVLEISVEDPQVQVTIEGNEEVVITGAGTREVRLRAGEHRLRATRDGVAVPINPDLVRIERDGKRVVTVRMLAAAPTKPAAHGAKVNLISNPGSEEAADDDGKQATYWIAVPRSNPEEPAAECYRDTTIRFKGYASLAVVKPQTKFPLYEAGFMQNVLGLPGGEKVFASGAIKTKDVQGSVAVKLRLLNDAGLMVGEHVTPPVSGTTDWKRYETSAVEVPPGLTGVLALVIQGKGTAWFDDLYLGTQEPQVDKPAPVPPGTNLLRNGGFETLVNEEFPQDWIPIGFGAAGITMKANTEVKHGGKASVTTINTGTDPQPYNWRQNLSHNLPVGKWVTLTGWVKTKDANLATVGVQLFDSTGQMSGFHSTQNKDKDFTGTADWRPFKLGFMIPRNTVSIGILAMLSGKGQVWFDDFELEVEDSKE